MVQGSQQDANSRFLTAEVGLISVLLKRVSIY